MSLTNLYDYSYEQLTEWADGLNISPYYVDLIWRAIYEQRVPTIADVNLPNPQIQQRLAEHGTLIRPKPLSCIDSSDGFTRKYLLQYPDGHSIETVIMEFDTRYTACVSTQVGCAMGCIFCATGQMGYTRHLTSGEVIAQILHVQDDLASRGKELRNLVFMGMGEPLHNYDNLLTSIDILTHRKGIDLAPKHITVSTVGLPHRIRDLADVGEDYPVHLAVSLHGATNAERQALIPVANKWTVEEVMDACLYYIEKRKRRIFFEWALIAGENDTAENAHNLGKLLQGIDCVVNVIPLNPTQGYGGQASQMDAVHAFQAVLWEYGIRSTVRQRRGIDVGAGCGQLAVLNS